MSGLSSNWEKLKAKLQAESTSKPELKATKRKAVEDPGKIAKKAKKTKLASTDGKAILKVKTGRVEKSGKSAVKTGKPIKSTPTKSTKSTKMGTAHSQPVAETTGPSPSLALWAEDNDVKMAESIAEAYELGVKKDNSMMLAAEKDRVNGGLTEGREVGKYVAIDCEMVGVGPGGHESSLARVSIVDFHGTQIYDSYVKQREKVTDWRTAYSGISVKEMRFARNFDEVQQTVDKLIKGKILIGHDVKHDLDVLKLSHPIKDQRDTARHHAFKKFGHGRKPALRNLARELLKVEIQSGAHSSVEDARVTMLLFRKHKSEFDVDHANRYNPKPNGGGGKGKGKKKK